ncbi:MAG: hypothetical protein ACR2NO_02780 [Chloroflexota bacterium]
MLVSARDTGLGAYAGEAGYRTAAIGKMHFYPWNNWGGFQDRIIAEDKTDYLRRDNYALWLEAHGHKREFPGDFSSPRSTGSSRRFACDAFAGSLPSK